MTSDIALARHRVRKFVDHRLQTTLIVALVLAQLALVAVCIWKLDAHLQAVLDADTYRVHFDTPPDADEFRALALRILTFFVATNLAMVLLIEMVWKTYVRVLLADYRALMSQVQQFDFTERPSTSAAHPLLALALHWHSVERQRLLGLRRCLEEVDAVAAGDPHAQRVLFADLADLLPRSQARHTEQP